MFQPQFNLFREHKLIHFNEAGPAVRSPEQNETQEIKLLSTERIAKLFGKFENDLNKSKENPLTNEKSKLLLNRASEKTKEAHTKLIFDLAKMSLNPGQEVVDRILAQTNTIESNDQHTTKPIEGVKESLNSATVQDYWEAMKAMPKDELASILINLVPILGDAKGALESALAKDVITGEAQGALERVAGAASAIPFLGAPLDISAALAKLSSSIGVVMLPIAKSGEKVSEVKEKFDDFRISDILYQKEKYKQDVQQRFGTLSSEKAKKGLSILNHALDTKLKSHGVDVVKLQAKEKMFKYLLSRKADFSKVLQLQGSKRDLALREVLQIPKEQDIKTGVKKLLQDFHSDRFEKYDNDSLKMKVKEVTQTLNEILASLK